MSGYFDLQVNGYAGIDFNSDKLSAQQLEAACQRLRDDGVDQILATIITDQQTAMSSRLKNLVLAREQSSLAREVIAGLHVEGPFLSSRPGYIGAHPVAAACDADLTTMDRLLEAGGGLIRMVTLAPERDADCRVTRYLADQHICVAAGHCNPSMDQLQAAIDAGLTLFTHLGNACPPELPRHDNVIQRALFLASEGKLKISLIADGAHLPPFVLSNMITTAGIKQCVCVTDAISAAGLGPGTFSLGNQTIKIGDDLIPWSADRTHFVGSATTMNRMVENLRQLGFSQIEVDWLLNQGPRELVAAA